MALQDSSDSGTALRPNPLVVQADGERVKALRLDRRWSQRELAAKVGCAKKTIENVEASKPVKIETLEEIAEALQVPPDQLVIKGAAEKGTPVTNGGPGSRPTEDAEGVDRNDDLGPLGEVLPKSPSDPTTDTIQPERSKTTTIQLPARIELHLEKDFDEFSEQDLAELLRFMRQALPLTGEVRVIAKRRGSVVLTLEMTPEDANRLQDAVRNGKLLNWKATKCQDLGAASPSRPTTTASPVNPPRPDSKEYRQGVGYNAKLLVVQGRPLGKTMLFPPGEYIFGRGNECHIRPNSDWVSRQHCLLRVRNEGRISVSDLGSRNGTLVNGVRVTTETFLKDGDHLQVGPLVFEVFADEESGLRRTPLPQGAQETVRTRESSDTGIDLSEESTDPLRPLGISSKRVQAENDQLGARATLEATREEQFATVPKRTRKA